MVAVEAPPLTALPAEDPGGQRRAVPAIEHVAVELPRLATQAWPSLAIAPESSCSGHPVPVLVSLVVSADPKARR